MEDRVRITEHRVSTPQPVMVRGFNAELRSYEIQEHELEVIEEGSPDSNRFTVGVSSISASIGFIVSLLTTSVSTLILIIFIGLIGIGIGIGVGSTLIYFSYKDKNKVAKIIKKIRAQLPPPPGEQI